MTDSLNTITQEKFDQAESLVISLLRSAVPNLDLRRGTVLRDLLVRPAASFYALEADRLAEAQATRSLQLMSEAGTEPTAEAVNAILSNFMVDQRVGSKATGLVRVLVSNNQTYTLSAGLTLTTLDGIAFGISTTYTAKPNPDSGDWRQLPVLAAEDGVNYYFNLPVQAVEPGVDGQVEAGTAFTLSTSFAGFVSATASAQFSGGADAETLDELIERLPAAISHRSLESRASIDAILRSADHGGFGDVLQAVSVVGYGDAAQLRDKHNAQGVAMGGKVDIYARSFNQPAYVTLEKRGTLISPNTYSIEISADDAPGFYAVRAVADAEAEISPSLEFGALPAIGSYDVADVRAHTNLALTRHDLDPANGLIESAFTTLQTATLIVNDVAGADAEYRQFKVQLYVAPQLADIQAYVDDPSVMNVKADYLVRCPVICLVGLRVQVVRHPGDELVDVEGMRAALANYINGRSFVAQLTESEIVAVLHQFDILRVNMGPEPSRGFQMSGVLRDAAGNVHQLSGPRLDLRKVVAPQYLLTADTIVFAIDPNDIYITVSDE